MSISLAPIHFHSATMAQSLAPIKGETTWVAALNSWMVASTGLRKVTRACLHLREWRTCFRFWLWKTQGCLQKAMENPIISDNDLDSWCFFPHICVKICAKLWFIKHPIVGQYSLNGRVLDAPGFQGLCWCGYPLVN